MSSSMRGRRKYRLSSTLTPNVGTSFWIPLEAPHNFDATGNAPTVLIEAFSFPREDYLERVAK